MPSSLTRVLPRASVSSTCRPVSVSGTGAPGLARGFSRPLTRDLRGFHRPSPSPPGIPRTDLPMRLPRGLDGPFQSPASLPRGVPPSLKRPVGGTGFSTCFPSATPLGLTLGPDSPWADDPSPGTLRLPANGILTRLFVTHTGILTSVRSSGPSGPPSPLNGTLPYPNAHPRASAAASVACLAPLIFGAASLDQ